MLLVIKRGVSVVIIVHIIYQVQFGKQQKHLPVKHAGPHFTAYVLVRTSTLDKTFILDLSLTADCTSHSHYRDDHQSCLIS
jgi:hypothetical protein